MNKKFRALPKYAIALVGIAFGLGMFNGKEAEAVNFYQDFASFDAVTNTTLVEDFESLPQNTPVGSFENNGNTYTSLGVEGLIVSGPGRADMTVINDSAFLIAGHDENYTVEFGTPSHAVGFDTYINSFGPATVQVFGVNGLLDTFLHDYDETTVGFLGIVADELITSIQWTTVNGRIQNTGIDNILLGESDNTTVPEPASILSLFVLGAIGSRSILKSRQQQ